MRPSPQEQQLSLFCVNVIWAVLFDPGDKAEIMSWHSWAALRRTVPAFTFGNGSHNCNAVQAAIPWMERDTESSAAEADMWERQCSTLYFLPAPCRMQKGFLSQWHRTEGSHSPLHPCPISRSNPPTFICLAGFEIYHQLLFVLFWFGWFGVLRQGFILCPV